MDEAKDVAGAGAVEEPVRTRCTIGSRATEASAGICSSGTPPRFSTGDETAELSSEDLISPCPIVRAYTLITLRTHIPERYYSE
jgi:hypothetical protein